MHVTFKNGKWQGLKIIGDANVPRGKVSFQTVDITRPTPAEIQIREEIQNEDGFSWKDGASVRFDIASDKWFIKWEGSLFSSWLGWLGLVGSSYFSRVNEMEALNANKNSDPK